jgi:hypothetical protein
VAVAAPAERRLDGEQRKQKKCGREASGMGELAKYVAIFTID